MLSQSYSLGEIPRQIERNSTEEINKLSAMRTQRFHSVAFRLHASNSAVKLAAPLSRISESADGILEKVLLDTLEWRNWQTHGTQNPASFTGYEGSTPSSSTISSTI